jgi:hypothetical protein
MGQPALSSGVCTGQEVIYFDVRVLKHFILLR